MSEQQAVQQTEKKEQQVEQQTESDKKPSRRGQNLSEYKTIRVKRDKYNRLMALLDSLEDQSEEEKSNGQQLVKQTEAQTEQKKKSDNSWIGLLVIGLLGLFLLLSPILLPKLGLTLQGGGLTLQRGGSNE